MTTETKPKRSRKKPEGVSAPAVKAPREPREMDTRNAEIERRRMAERGSRNLLAALARSAFKHGIALRNMTPEEQLRAALADGWQGRVIGASRWAGGA
jgi:hypothetical protein